MSFADQLLYAHQQQFLKTGIESKVQDGVQDPFQERSHGPWKGEELHGMGTGAASSNDKATSLLKDKGKRPAEYQMCTPPQGPRASLSPMPLTEPPGLGGLPLPGGRPASGEATADKDRSMTLCGARLTKLYKELEQDYDRVHSTSKGDDQRETTHEELETQVLTRSGVRAHWIGQPCRTSGKWEVTSLG